MQTTLGLGLGDTLEEQIRQQLAFSEVIDGRHIVDQQDVYAARFSLAQPFRHVVVDGFLQPESARALERSFPPPQPQALTIPLVENRHLQRDCNKLPYRFQQLYGEMCTTSFVAWLERVTAIRELEPDRRQHIEIGLIQSGNGSYHDVHADPNMHAERDVFRRITILVYLNEVWLSKWGGSLEFWSSDAKQLVTSIQPSFNRCLIMENHDRAYHGYRTLHTPPGITRKAMAMVYFAATPGQGQSTKRHGTRFRLRPDDSLQRRASHTLFAVRRVAAATRNALFRYNRSA